MRGLAYVLENLAGAWRVMLGRPDGLQRLDTTLEGFWRSFGVVILVAPFAFLALMSQQPLVAEGGTAELTGGQVVLDAVTLLVDWFAFPLVFALAARPLGLGPRYVPFIVARNWASVIISAIISIIHVLHLAHVLPDAAMPFALLLAIAVSLRFAYVIARTTLMVSAFVALPIIFLDLLMSLVIWAAFDRLA